MDYTLVVLIVLIVLAVVGSHRYHSRTWSGRPGYQYQRVITAAALGLGLTSATRCYAQSGAVVEVTTTSV